MKKNEIGVVLFDWDFTLAYTLGDVSLDQRIAALFKHVGLPYGQQAVEEVLEDYRNAVERGQARPLHRMQRRRDIVALYRYILARLGHSELSRELMYRIYSAYAHLPTKLYDDARPSLQTLQERGLKLGILSNHSVSVRAVVERLVGDYIPSENITISEEIGVHKPSKTIFQRAAARLAAPPASCLYVGDNLAVDALAAVQVGGYGMGLWLDRRGKGTTRELPENVARITSLHQVVDFI
ncbi:MAG TPA: HAD family hydrolase [Anaerolineae bacterium]